MKEIPSFRDDYDFHGYYITKDGEVYSTHYRKGLGVKKLTPQKRHNGYWTVAIAGHQEYIHRLVAITYIPNPENKREVNHKDLNKDNYIVGNLEWSTPSENVIHSKKYCTKKSKTSSNKGTLYHYKTKIKHFDSLQQAKLYCEQNYQCTLCTIGTTNVNRRHHLVFIRDDSFDFDINRYWKNRELEVSQIKKVQEEQNKLLKGYSGVLFKGDEFIKTFNSVREANAQMGLNLRKRSEGIYGVYDYKFFLKCS